MKTLYSKKKTTRVALSSSNPLKESGTPPFSPLFGFRQDNDRQVDSAQGLFQKFFDRSKFLAVLLIAGILSLGTARADVKTVENAEERVETLVHAINSLNKEQKNVVVIIVRGDIKHEITNVSSAHGDRRLLMLDYAISDDSRTYQAVVDVTDVLLIEERSK